MMTKTIQKLSKAKFKLSTDNVPNSVIELDFNPLIDKFASNDRFLIVHWQGMPKGYRQWGVYSSLTDNYHSVTAIDLQRVSVEAVQLDDKTATTKPSAVLLIKDAKLLLVDDTAIICSNKQSIDID